MNDAVRIPVTGVEPTEPPGELVYREGEERLPVAPEVLFKVADSVSVFNEPGGVRAEAINALRTHFMAQHLPLGRRSLALCSPTAGVGCTSLAANMAVALAEGGLKTLLIDADLRRPAVHRHIVPSREVPGLRQCLADEAAFGDVIQFDVLPNLSVTYAGGRSDRPHDLLATPRFQQFVDLCLRDFDITIVDTPPSSVSADARRIAAVVGYAMVVIGRDKTFVGDVKVLTEELTADGAVVVGSVLNQP